jgi:agmatinase
MTTAVVFPFDLFGSAGTGAGAQLLGDALREILDDNDAETQPTRADVYRGKLRIREAAFETPKQITDWRKRGRTMAQQALEEDDFLLWFAGNHLGVLPVLEALGGDTLVVQFDAHFDLDAGLHDTTRELSHGNFLSHLEKPRPRIVHVGHRDLFLKPNMTAKAFEAVHSAPELALDPAAAIKTLKAKAAAAKRVWIDIDCDVLDPAYFPAVPLPMPFGLSPMLLLKLMDAAWAGNVCGLSLSEFDPGRDVRDTSLSLLGWLMEYVLLKRYGG